MDLQGKSVPEVLRGGGTRGRGGGVVVRPSSTVRCLLPPPQCPPPPRRPPAPCPQHPSSWRLLYVHRAPGWGSASPPGPWVPRWGSGGPKRLQGAPPRVWRDRPTLGRAGSATPGKSATSRLAPGYVGVPVGWSLWFAWVPPCFPRAPATQTPVFRLPTASPFVACPPPVLPNQYMHALHQAVPGAGPGWPLAGCTLRC